MAGNEENAEQRAAEGLSQPPEAPRPQPTANRKWVRSAVVVVVLVVAASLGVGLLAEPGAEGTVELVPTAVVERGNLVVSVSEPGALWAMEPLEIKSEVEGWNVILEIVEEGTVITEQDVEDGMVLVRLDSAGLEEREASREISFYRAEAAYTEANENYEIQKKQNESNIAIARLNLKFAGMELERYLGAELAAKVLQEGFGAVDLGPLAQGEVDLILAPEQSESAEPAAPATEAECRLGGTACQRIRTLSTAVQIAYEELTRAEGERQWSEELALKQYISRNELVRDRLEAQRRKVALESAKEALRLFRVYTFPKDAEQRYSDDVERQRDLVRVEARARSQLTQAEAALKSSKASYELQEDRLNKTREMIQKCIIRATKPGRVVYGGSSSPWGRDPILEGTSVRQNTVLIEIPDVSTLAARVNIREAVIDKVKVGQPALISFEAIPGKLFLGHVAKISPMASSEHRRLNPDSKVYETDVKLDEVPEDFMLGMSATPRIIIAYVKDVLHVPLQAVKTDRGRSFCWVKMPDGPQLRRLETGQQTDMSVEIVSGVRLGEEVYLAPPNKEEEEKLEALVEALDEAEEEAGRTAGPRQETQSAGRGGGPRAGQPPAQEGEDAAQGEDAAEGEEIDWPELQGLSDEERQKKMQEILEKMTPEQRRQYEERRSMRQSMPSEDRQRMRQGRGGGGGGGGGGQRDRSR